MSIYYLKSEGHVDCLVMLLQVNRYLSGLLRGILQVLTFGTCGVGVGRTRVTIRVVSSEISGGKFLEIYSNLQKFVNYPRQLVVSKSNIAK